MPIINEEELRKQIDAGSIGGLSLDTTVFFDFSFDLTKTTLLSLSQFGGSNISVLFSEITIREIHRRLRKILTDTQDEFKSSMVKYKERWQENFDETDILKRVNYGGDPASLARKQINEFIKYVNGTFLPVKDFTNFDEILKRYFHIEAPFEDKNGKRKEFPDAMALLSLETWAHSKKSMVVVISDDNGWEKYCNESKHIFIVRPTRSKKEGLNDILNCFNQPTYKISSAVVRKAMPILNDKKDEGANNYIESKIIKFLEDSYFIPDISTFTHYETESLSAILQQWNIANDSEPSIIAVDEKTVTFSITLSCEIEFTFNVDFLAYDSIDKDYTLLHSEEYTKIDTVDLTAVITFSREPKVEFVDIDITARVMEPNIGYIEPSWNEDEKNL